jgi:DNA-binding FrmR family transcriptional regulator
MAHTQRDKTKLLARIKRIQGQLDAVADGLRQDSDCHQVLQTLASARGALGGLVGEVIEGHVREHVLGARSPREAAQAGQEFLDIMKSYWR